MLHDWVLLQHIGNTGHSAFEVFLVVAGVAISLLGVALMLDALFTIVEKHGANSRGRDAEFSQSVRELRVARRGRFYHDRSPMLQQERHGFRRSRLQ